MKKTKQMMRVQSGFTLIETMLTLMLCSILAYISITGLQSLLETSKETAYRIKLLHIITTANETAKIIHRTITICHSTDLKTCDGNWRDGLLVKTNEGQVINSERFNMPGNLLVRFFPRFRQDIQFDPHAEASNDNGTLWYCRLYASHPQWAIKINRMGIATVQLPDKNGEIKDSTGKLFNCHQQLLS